jgi:cytochrome c-type biogenesis protein
MLPGFIGYYLSQEEEGQSAGKSKRSPIKTGIIAASGLLLVYLILGALALLIGMSSKAQDGGSAGGMPSGSGGMFLYGIGYGAAAAGCTLPLVIGTFLIALSSGLLIGLIVVLVFSFSAAGLMVLVTFLVGTSRDTVVNKLKASTETIKKLGGLLMIVGGIVVIIYWYFAH